MQRLGVLEEKQKDLYGKDWGRNAVCGTEVAAGERYDKTEVFSEYIVMFFMKNIQFDVLASMEGTPPVSCAIAALVVSAF